MNERWQLEHHRGLPYRVLLPVDYAPTTMKYPVVVYLHGSGERGDDSWAQLKNGPRAFEDPALQTKHPCIVVAPQAPEGETFGGSWYGGPSATQQLVASLVEELRGQRSVDAQRVSLIGFSMGAIGGWDLVLRRPTLFSAFVALAGALEPKEVGRLTVPTWAFHGSDDPSVPCDQTREAFALTQARSLPMRYTELSGVGHEVWRPAFETPALFDWLFAQRRAAT